jgi:hypothetical protein
MVYRRRWVFERMGASIELTLEGRREGAEPCSERDHATVALEALV